MDTKHGRKVAIKLLRYHSEKGEARIKREGEALAQVDHPNVVQFFEMDSIVDGVYYLVLEYIEGVSLDAWLAEQPRSRDEIFGVFVQAARGLNAIHARGLIHRDFKPSNLVLGKDGRCRIIDFGLARRFTSNIGDRLDQVRASSSLATPSQTCSATTVSDKTVNRCTDSVPSDSTRRETKSCTALSRSELVEGGTEGDGRCGRPYLDVNLTQRGKFAGTPAYAAPEQIAGEKLDTSADVFSFCVTLCEALFGERPPNGPTPLELRRYLRRRRVPRAVRHLLRRGLSIRPEIRPKTMGSIIDELETRLSMPKSLRTAFKTVTAVAAVAGIAAVSFWPTSLESEWTSSPAAREHIAKYQPGLAAQLDAFEQSWLSIAADTYPAFGSAEKVNCLQTGQEQFESFVAAIAHFPRHATSTFESSAPSRLWFTTLLAPSRCAEHRMTGDERTAIEFLLESQSLQLEGRYDEALKAVDSATELEVPLLGRLRGAIEAQRGHMQSLLGDPRAWHTLGLAAQANEGDLEFLVEVLSLRAIDGFLSGRLDEKVDELVTLNATLATYTERLGTENLRARAWYHIVQSERHAVKEPESASEHLQDARRLFAESTSGARRALLLSYVDLLDSATYTRRGEFETAAQLASSAIERVDGVIASDHSFLIRARVDAAMLVANAGSTFAPRARQLLLETIEHAPSGFQAVRAQAELLYLDLKKSKAEDTAKNNEELFRRSMEIEKALTPHLASENPEDIAWIALAVAKTRLITFFDRSETLGAVTLWIDYENDKKRRADAIGYRRMIEKKIHDTVSQVKEADTRGHNLSDPLGASTTPRQQEQP